MPKEIKQRIVLEGEQKYNQAIKEAQRNLRTLKSELKAETAELGANATAQQKSEARARSLKQQIKEQEQIVKALRDALEEVKENYGDNADEVARWEQKLNGARTTLANMKNDLERTGAAYTQIEAGAKRSATENAALAISFEKIAESAGNISGKIERVFSGIAETITGALGAVWSELIDIAAKSDSWMDLSAYLGASAEEVQQWDRAMKAAHGDLSTITGLISRLKYGGKANSVAEWFGVSGENYTNDLEYAQAVLQRMADMKDEMVANGTWDDAMSDILGARKAQEIDSILSDWEEIQRNLKAFDVENGGVGLTGDELQTMNELYSQVGLLQERWNAFKQSVEAKLFGQLALNMTSNFQGALDALIEFMDADPDSAEGQEKREAAIEKFKENLVEAFTALGEAIAAAGEALEEAGNSLQESENGYVKLLGELLSTLGTVMQWMADPDNLEAIKGFFEVLIGIWAGTKMITAVATLAKLAAAFSTIKANRLTPGMLNGLEKYASGDGSTGDTGGTGNTGGPAPIITPTETVKLDTGIGMAAGFVLNEAERLIHEGAEEDRTVNSLLEKYGLDLNRPEVSEAVSGALMGLPEGADARNPETWGGAVPGTGLPEDLEDRFAGIAERYGSSDSGDFRIQQGKSLDEMLNDVFAWAAGAAMDLVEAGENVEDVLQKAHDYNIIMNDALREEEEREQELLDQWQGDFDDGWSGLPGGNRAGAMPPNWWTVTTDWGSRGSRGTPDENGISSADLRGFLDVPSGVESAAEKGVRRGISGLSVQIDGQTAGRILAPYVSQEIARSMG